MSKHKILCVEDKEFVLLAIKKQLEAEGYEVTTSTSGEKAIKLLEKEHFDLVITDVVMGEVNGFEVVEKAKELYPETMIMILTGYKETDFVINALRLGVDDYLIKPIDKEDLLFSVQRCLEKGELLRKNKQTETELLFLSSAIKQSTEGIGTVDLEGILIFVHEAMAAMHGYLPEELIGKHLSIFHTPEQMADVEKANKQTQETGEFIGEIWHMRKDRTIFPGIMHNSIIQDENGNPIGITGTLRDITERKKSEEILKTQEQVLESMAEGVNMSDENGIIFFTNPRFDALFGYERDKLIGKNVLVLNSYSAKENAQYVAEVIKQLETKGTWSGEVSNRKKDGTQFTTYARVNSLEISGKRYFVSVQDDITERVRVEEELRESEKKFREITERIYDAIITVDNLGRITYASPAVKRISGYSVEEVVGKNTKDFFIESEITKLFNALTEIVPFGLVSCLVQGYYWGSAPDPRILEA